MESRLSAPATQRNREPILAILRRVLPADASVLEIASGTGEHAVFLAAELPGRRFQPSDPDPAHRASISAWMAAAGAPNLLAPLDVDVTVADWEETAGLPNEITAILCINMIHIAPWRAAQGLLRGAAAALAPGCVLYLYGPFRRGGRHTAPSNEAFDRSLRERNSEWGVRDLETFVAEAERFGFGLDEIVQMPANNLSVVLRRRAPA